MKVLISGGGIAGLTMAYWLKRYGFVERAPTLLTGARAITLKDYAMFYQEKSN